MPIMRLNDSERSHRGRVRERSPRDSSRERSPRDNSRERSPCDRSRERSPRIRFRHEIPPRERSPWDRSLQEATTQESSSSESDSSESDSSESDSSESPTPEPSSSEDSSRESSPMGWSVKERASWTKNLLDLIYWQSQCPDLDLSNEIAYIQQICEYNARCEGEIFVSGYPSHYNSEYRSLYPETPIILDDSSDDELEYGGEWRAEAAETAADEIPF